MIDYTHKPREAAKLAKPSRSLKPGENINITQRVETLRLQAEANKKAAEARRRVAILRGRG